MNLKAQKLENRLVEFSVAATRIAEKLPSSRSNANIRNQLVRSCVSPALNYAEAQVAESNSDFVHKLKICLKELKESQVSLKIIKAKNIASISKEVNRVLEECNELVAIFVSSTKTATKSK